MAARMRPRNLSEVVGHAALLGPNALLPRLIKADNFGSLLFYGPPGCGKTTLAEVIAAETESTVVRVNAVLSGTPELREVLAEARRSPSRKTVLVVDEIHRFNKAQQDSFELGMFDVPPVRCPFPDITNHVVQTIFVRWVRIHRSY